MPTRDGAQALSCWKLPMDVELEPLLLWCVENRDVNRLLVTARFWRGARGKREGPNAKVVQAMESLFRGRILRRVLARKWPGTEVIGSEAIVFVIGFDAALMKPMVEAAPRLAEWTRWNDPPLPEDLCLYRQGDEWPALMSITHEGDAWVFGTGDLSLTGATPSQLDAEYLGVPMGAEDFVDGARPWEPGHLNDRQLPEATLEGGSRQRDH